MSGRTREGSYWSTKAYAWSQEYLPEIVIIMLGTNDSKHPNWNAANYRKDLTSLVQSYKVLPSNPKVHLMVPPRAEATEHVTEVYGMQPDIIETSIPEIIHKIGEDENVPVIDLSKLFVDSRKPSHIYAPGDPGYWSSDGVHPDDAGYQKMAQYIYDHLNL